MSRSSGWGVVARRSLTMAVLAGLVAAEPSFGEDDRARAILDRIDDLFRGDSSRGRATMRVRTEHWTRSLTLEMWSEGKEKSLIRILAPKKERGTATLRVGNDLWNYLPKVKRVIKLPSSMMSASWMGSHVTNDDLVKESRMADDYRYEITFEGQRDGTEVIDLTLVPRPDAVVEWGKVVATVRAEDQLPVAIAYYDEDLRLARTMTYSEIESLGGRSLPARLEIVPADEPGESTEIHWEALEFDPGIDDDLFSLRSLRR